MKRPILSLVLLPMLFTAPALAAEAMNDLQIAHAAYTAGDVDIRYAHLALALSENADVRDFATTMVRDHAAVNEAAIQLVTELKVTPEDNALSQALAKGAANKRAELMSLEGEAFDCAYATNELAYHQIVNKTIAESFLPAVTVAPLKDLLEEALATFTQHEGHAENMVAKLGCAS
ncbi:MAG: DUF4142 domain-containing protein [Hoeflea sp.]|uniref:DUF4142 domain-containing protein n=1 Tax=Hoeflea sp. TaxID=1940281 RepID=UPI003EF5B822